MSLLKPSSFKINSILTAILVYSLVSGLPLITPFLNLVELKTLDLRFRARGELNPGKETVIIAIDEKSQDKLGRWPWPRSQIARLIEILSEARTKVIAFDIVFSEPDENSSLLSLKKLRERFEELRVLDEGNKNFYSYLLNEERSSDNDAFLAKALEQARCPVVLGFFFFFHTEEVKHLDEAYFNERFKEVMSSRIFARWAPSARKDFPFINGVGIESNLRLFSQKTKNFGFFSMLPDEDEIYRWNILTMQYKGEFFPSLGLKASSLFLNEPILLSIKEYGIDNISLGGLKIPTDERGRLLVNYKGPQQTFPHISFVDVLERKVPSSTFKDRIVLIGATGIGIYDLRPTPFGILPGIEIHANVIDNILHRNFLIKPNWVLFMDIGAILIFGILLTFFLPKLKAIKGSLFALSLSVIHLVITQYLFTRKGIWVNSIYPFAEILSVFLATTVFHYMVEEKEKRFIKGAFSQYLAPAVINELVNDPAKLKLGGEKRILTAFFSDVTSFSSISEKLSPEELVELLNVYLTEMTNIILKYEGTVDKYEGDAIIAFFGAPIEQPDHALRACYVCLDMQKRLCELREMWKKEGKPLLYARMGLNTGPMVVGNMGSQTRMDYTIMGDAVNLASRLEGANKQYGTYIMMGENTYHDVKDTVEVRELDSIRVVGKTEPVKVYELLGRKGELDDGMAQIILIYEEGLTLYKSQKWKDSIKAFEKMLQINNQDGPSITYLKRCHLFLQNPPPPDWDGVFELKEK